MIYQACAEKNNGTSDVQLYSCFFEKKPMGLLVVLLLVGSVFLLNTSVWAQQLKNVEKPGEYIIGSGDVLEVLVFGEPDISKIVSVRMDGRISLPLAGEFWAADCTPTVLAKKISEKLERFVEGANVSVILTESNSKAYYVLGQVNSPGEYPMTQSITVLQAIARAGGFLEWARKSHILIVSRPDQAEKITIFDYDAFLNGAGRKQNVVISPGDTIVIP